MTYSEAMKAIDALKPGGMKMGLARMRRILARLGNPQESLRVVHVAGTNGKGSTARMIQAMASASGVRTGLYTSPAVTGLRDTVTVDGQAIPEETFAALTEELLSHIPAMGDCGGLSEFELTTALSLLWFAREKTELCVVECGLGGRDDATNVFASPLAAVFTPISLDHQNWLGTTVEDIARNKCGILKPGCGVVTCPGQDPDALGVLLEEAAGLGLTVRMPNRAAAPFLEDGPDSMTFSWEGTPLTLHLTGVFQRDNALTALETLRVLEERGFRFSRDQVVEGLAWVRMPCRQEILRRSPLLMLDAAHNPQGVGALRDTLLDLPREDRTPLTMVMGMLADKDAAACAALLAPLCAHIVCCTPENPRALPAETLAALLRSGCPDVEAVPDISAALDRALQKAGGGPLLVAGSFYVSALLRPRLTALVNSRQKL